MTDTGATTFVKLLRRRLSYCRINHLTEHTSTRITGHSDQRATPARAGPQERLFLGKLICLVADYRELHMQVIDKTEDDHCLGAEQDTLDKHGDAITSLTSRAYNMS